MAFDEAASTPVVSRAPKFVLPVPRLAGGGEPLVYPPGHPSAGRPILDHAGKPVGDRGVVFYNAKDRAWQAAPGTGEGVVIINEVGPDDARRLAARVRALAAAPAALPLDGVRAVLRHAADDLGLGDIYNSTRAYVAEKLRPAPWAEPARPGDDPAYGAKVRTAADAARAVFVAGPFEFLGPAATPQQFPDGGVLVRHGDGVRGVQPDVFARTYELPDGRPVASPARDLQPWRP